MTNNAKLTHASVKNEKKPLADFELVTASRVSHCDINVIIYYVITGSMRVKTNTDEITMPKGTFLILDSFELHSVHLDASDMVMQYTIDLRQIAGLCDITRLEFAGNSVYDNSPRELTLKNLLDKFVPYYQSKHLGDARIELKLQSMYYELTELLLSLFSTAKNEEEPEESAKSSELLVREMIGYLHTNYRYPLKLNDLAEQFYLSPAYISRFFKKNLGVNFTKYLNNLRLDAAVEKLKATDDTLTRIAMDCGFSNLSAFNTAFRERHQMTPKEYRRTLPAKAESTADEAGEFSGSLPVQEGHTAGQRDDSYEQIEEVAADTGVYTILNKNWNKLINVGGISILLEKNIQDQVLFLCRTLQFEYVRVWDLYAHKLHINAGHEPTPMNFSRLDACLDFLAENNIRLYLELGFKPFILVKDYENWTYHEERDIPFETPEGYGSFIRKLMQHLLGRYGSRTVSSWIFEVWGDPRWFPDGDPTTYITWFEAAYNAVKDIVPNAKIGGNYDRHYRIVSFERLIERWSMRSIQPDFISLYCYESFFHHANPYSDHGGRPIPDDDSGAAHNFQLSQYVRIRKETLLNHGMMMPVHCSEWNSTVVNANPLNDNAVKGAYVMKDALALHREVDLLGYWFGTDLFVDEDDAPHILDGRCGLITHQGICKPSYWALWMLNHLEDYLLYEDDRTMVTMNEFDRYVVTLHNYKSLDYQYYMLNEMDISIESIPQLFPDHRRLVVQVTINGIKNGDYHVETHSLNTKHGSVQDEWLRSGKTDTTDPAAAEYLKHISRPQITYSTHTITDGTLKLYARLEPQEIQMIRVALIS